MPIAHCSTEANMRVLFFTVLLMMPAVAGAQSVGPPAPPRAEISGSVAWLHVPFDSVSPEFFHDREWTRHATATARGAVYWTEHWKSEVSIARSTSVRTWDTEPVRFGTEVAFRSITHNMQFTRVGFAQVYQFRRNEWVHPSLGAGVLFQQRSGESLYDPALVHRPPTGVPVTVAPAERRSLGRSWHSAPFVSAAVKAYVTPQVFFRSDLELAFRREVESVAMHAGFGFDF
jgi:hypothetical protein